MCVRNVVLGGQRRMCYGDIGGLNNDNKTGIGTNANRKGMCEPW